MKSPTVLMILDGFGLNDNTKGNAVYSAKTPNIDNLMAKYPYVKGNASGLAVGLPAGQMGNSEVGHLNMGAGRIVYQDLTRITKEIEDGDFFRNEVLLQSIENVKANNSSLHLFGLLSDGGVHSHNTHLYGLLELAKRNGLEKVYVHCFLDGRDTPPSSAKGFISELESKIKEIGVGKIATVCGRYYAMDRDNRWERVARAYDLLTKGIGAEYEAAVEGVEASYNAGVTDEFVEPIVVIENGAPVATVKDNDSVIFYNFRPDRAREMTRAFCSDDFTGFDRGNRKDVTFVCFTEYDVTIPNKTIAFKKVSLDNTFGEYLAANGKTQARIAETEKYAHVTFFFNNGLNDPFKNEDRILISSPKVATYDLKPSMSANEVKDAVVEQIEACKYDVIILNYANCDMVGHTGVIPAAVEAVETVDACIGRVLEALNKINYNLFITADHGNAEKMIDPVTKQPHTAHTTNKVPFICVSNIHKDVKLKDGGKLADIAPTMLDIMGMKIPEEMTGESLIK